MIVAIEGPDCSGKTTLFDAMRDALPDATFVPRNVTTPETMQCMTSIVSAVDHLWKHTYDKRRLYVCDRHYVVSNPIYDALYRREMRPVFSEWWPEVRVVLLDPPLAELERRYSVRGDAFFELQSFSLVRRLYLEHVKNFRHIRIGSIPDLTAIVEWIRCELESTVTPVG